ncbi:PEP-CTERM sorting domain-containing protein [Sedimentitalea arenosa]|uniref:VPLPA-CTERM sorting domain-containing protein n=1 Tax=Sedimentitalea arenosa TaxID=2798803 RepID=A0A8J7IJZ6_9RHOB|nr:PEP-CTERM sorting domain-containing protein [Arenibacterium arenosum]MBJ6371163.1 VPLPA-CTERM sorting domain-containing protein [Arenibacterium arenosum]
MFYRVFAAAFVAVALSTAVASAATLIEADFGEFGDRFDVPTDFTGYDTIVGSSNEREDFEYFRFDSFLEGTTSLEFSLTNAGQGSNMLIRLSSTPFTMSEWDWTIDEFEAGSMSARELYANQWDPEDRYTFVLPDGFEGPLYGFVRFYSTNSDSSFSISATGAQGGGEVSPVPVPAALPMMLAALGAMGAVYGARRRSA